MIRATRVASVAIMTDHQPIARDDVRYAIGMLLLTICTAIMALHLMSVMIATLATRVARIIKAV